MWVGFDGGMIPRSLLSLSRRANRLLAPAAVGAMLLAGCSSGSSDAATAGVTEPSASGAAPSDDAATDESSTGTADDPPDTTAETAATTDAAPGTTATSSVTAADVDLGAVGTLSSTEVHDIAVEFDQAAFEAMVETYTSTGDKAWISATVTIDGTTYENVGLRLKGNSSLRGVTATDDPATIPWLVKLDEFVQDQDHEGLEEFVVRSSRSESALNEAVALELLDLAGLASQDAVAVRFSVNGGDAELRLVIDSPDGEWMAEELSDSGALYKAESTGDWSYRGDDPASYDEVFDQEAGKDNADLTPLIEFLEFINESDDATFEAELSQWLDVESFATYLAMQDLLDNFDDINGPGNNAYLYWDTEAERFTVVPWDYNLAFGQRPGGAGGEFGGDVPGGGDLPAPPDGFDPSEMGDLPAPPDGVDPSEMGDMGGGRGGFGGGPGGMMRDNPLVDRFLANEEWNALYEQATVDLRAALYDSGTASSILEQWSSIVSSSGLVDAATIANDAAAIDSYLS
jgi:spore coat protein CotH